MSKFKKGDVISAIDFGRGFNEATVLNIFTETKGVGKGRECYLLKIMNGTATVPVASEVCYQLVKKKKK